MPRGLADQPPMSSVPECRQTPGGLHPQRSKAWGDTVPSEALLPWLAANMALDIFFIYISNVAPFPDFPPENSLIHSRPPAHQSIHSLFPVLAFPNTGASSLLRTKGLSSL